MRKIILIAVLSLSTHAFASNTSANAGHHGGGNMGAVGAAAGAFGGGSGAASGGDSAGQSGTGGNYWAPNPHASAVDAYQPWAQSEMRQYQKP